MRPFLTDNLFAVHDARAVDETVQAAKAVDSGGDRSLAARLVGDIGLYVSCGTAKFLRERSPGFRVHVGQHDIAAASDNHPRRRGAQARRAAGDDERAVLQIHWLTFLAP